MDNFQITFGVLVDNDNEGFPVLFRGRFSIDKHLFPIVFPSFALDRKPASTSTDGQEDSFKTIKRACFTPRSNSFSFSDQ